MTVRKHVLSLIMLTACLGASAQMHRGDKSLGVKGGYITLNHAPAAGLQFEYTFSDHFVLAPNIDYVFRNEQLDGLLFNLDYHGPWNLSPSGRASVYHILGLNYASWSSHTLMDGGDADVIKRYNRIGLDFGLGMAFYLKPTLKLSIEGKFNWLKHHNTGIFTAGLGYVF